MRYSNNLLKRYISLDVHPDQIARELTLKVCEVEEMHIRAIPEEVVIGKVTAIKPHPNADKLTVCQLDCGSKGTYQICTGGENVVVNSYVPVALPGCFLPAINLKIEPREMRGEASNGMICSKQEIGIPENLDDHWIWTLQYAQGTDLTTVPQQPDMDDIIDKDLGRALGDKYPWLNNRMADVENKTITHRPDLFGHFGMSVELDAIFPGEASFSNGKKYMEQITKGNIFETLGNATASKRKIEIQTDRVLTYTALELNNIQIKESDLLLRAHLYDLGLQPKNNWVDLSNLFMYLTGQPVHFFDAQKVTRDIIVRQAKAGETFVDLLGKEHTLIDEDIVIADSSKILALAGVIGGNNSCIDETTTDIIVEIANFDPVTVRKTGTRLALRTDAELRFEKNINPLYSLHTTTMFLDEMHYFAKSLGNYTIGGVSRRASSLASTKVMKKISLDTLMVERLLFGQSSDATTINITDEAIAKILLSLGCSINKDREVTIPARRGPADITQEIDLVEEIARIYGFETIQPVEYKDQSRFVPFNPTISRNRTIEELLARDYGYDQIETYPWIDQHWIDLYGLVTDTLYTMENPLTPEQRYVRNTMIWSMLEVVEKNAPFFEEMKLFDIGKTREQGRESPEQECIGLAYRQKNNQDRSHDGLLHTKGVISGILSALGIKGKVDYLSTDNHLFHVKQQATITLNQQPIGSIQTVHPYQLQKSKIPAQSRLVLAEVSLHMLKVVAANQKRSLSQPYETLQDQIIRRDLNFVIDATMNYGAVAQAVQKVKEIKSVELFDLYAGDRLPEGKKSIGLRVKLVGSGELQTQQINDIMQLAVQAVESIGGELRK